MAGWVAMAEGWNVRRDRLEVRAVASDPACRSRLGYLVSFLRRPPEMELKRERRAHRNSWRIKVDAVAFISPSTQQAGSALEQPSKLIRHDGALRWFYGQSRKLSVNSLVFQF